MKLETLCSALHQHKVAYALVGGHAVALYGAVRGTVDYDFIVQWNLANLKRAEKALGELGLVSRAPVKAEDIFSFKDEYIENRNMIAWNFYDPKNPLSQVDIVITHDLKGRKRKKLVIRETEIFIIGLDDLIDMKTMAGREQDLEDIRALKRIRDESQANF